MKYVSRKDLGWPASAAPAQTDPVKGVKLHYEGSPVPDEPHSKCAARWTAIRKAHLNHPTEDYSDVAYNWAVCNHGVKFEGRGLGKRTGANGNQSLNRTHYAILWMGGTKGVTTPSSEAVTSIKELIQYLREHDTGKEIKGHRDGHATACPGDALYALVKSGKLEPTKPATPPAKPAPSYAPFPGANYFKYGKKSPIFLAVGKRLVAEGYKGYKVGPSTTWGPADERGVKWFQLQHKELKGDADGKFGPLTWKMLKVPKS